MLHWVSQIYLINVHTRSLLKTSMKIPNSLYVAILSTFLFACASTKDAPDVVDPVYVALEDVAKEIKTELVLISERQQIRSPNRNGVQGTNEALNILVERFDYTGNIDGALVEVSELIGYRFINNRVGSFPVTVILHEENVPLLEVVRSIGAQAGSDVSVVISERYREIRLEDK